MTVLTDIKQVYPEFKLIKDYYTLLNKSESVVLTAEGNYIKGYYTSDPFFILTIEISTPALEFTKWLNGKFVKVELKDLQLVKKVLKKNVKSISYNDSSFIFTFLSDDIDVSVDFNKLENFNTEKTVSILKLFKTEYEFVSEYLNPEILQLFNYDDIISNSKISEEYSKIIEIPSKRLLATQKDAKYFISFSERDDNGYRYVMVKSISENILIKQIFLTI